MQDLFILFRLGDIPITCQPKMLPFLLLCQLHRLFAFIHGTFHLPLLKGVPCAVFLPRAEQHEEGI